MVSTFFLIFKLFSREGGESRSNFFLFCCRLCVKGKFSQLPILSVYFFFFFFFCTFKLFLFLLFSLTASVCYSANIFAFLSHVQIISIFNVFFVYLLLLCPYFLFCCCFCALTEKPSPQNNICFSKKILLLISKPAFCLFLHLASIPLFIN